MAENIFKSILYGDEAERFFKQFTSSEPGRAAVPGTNFPSTIEEVVRDTKEIWQKKGLLTPAELRNELNARYMPGVSPQVLETMNQMELSRNQPGPPDTLWN